jgi:hypothetical protein
MMDASKPTSREGNRPDGSSIEYDRERQLWRLVDSQAQFIADLARTPKDEEDLDDVAERYRKLAREAAFFASVIEDVQGGEE